MAHVNMMDWNSVRPAQDMATHVLSLHLEAGDNKKTWISSFSNGTPSFKAPLFVQFCWQVYL